MVEILPAIRDKNEGFAESVNLICLWELTLLFRADLLCSAFLVVSDGQVRFAIEDSLPVSGELMLSEYIADFRCIDFSEGKSLFWVEGVHSEWV